jgi:signal transduction histidine kinase/HAMP domain-containing protein
VSEPTSFPEIERRKDQEPIELPPIKTGLQWKFTAIITLVICGISLLFFSFYHQAFQHSVMQEFEKHGLSLASLLAETDALPGQPSGALRLLMKSPEVAYIVLLDSQGNSRLSYTQDIAGLAAALPSTKFEKRASNVSRRAIPGLGMVYDFCAPIKARVAEGSNDPKATQLGGMVRVGLSAAPLEYQFRIRTFVILGGILTLVLLGILLAWFLSQIIIRPMQRLARAMKIVATDEESCGDNEMPVGRRFRRMDDLDLNVHTQDEIEQLADEFQAMMRKLEKSYAALEKSIEEKSRIAQEKSQLAEDLKELNRKNEALVKERTREVVEKNLRLYEISEELQFQKEELISMNEQLEKSSRMKSEFLASMSHELRTPLNSIIGFAEVLKEKMFGDLNERQEKYLSNILASGQHLLQLVNNILDIAKVEAGKMKLNIESFYINRVIEEVQNIIRTLAYKKNIELRLELAPEITIHGDAAKFKQILYNLLSNAIKFTDEKGLVTISTRKIPASFTFQGGPGSEAFETPDESILLSIADTGIGIKREDQERIFLEFEQTNQTRKRKYEGTGLGLALTRKLVHLHDGHIWVKSTVGEGTEVLVVLPVTAQNPDAEPQEEDQEP